MRLGHLPLMAAFGAHNNMSTFPHERAEGLFRILSFVVTAMLFGALACVLALCFFVLITSQREFSPRFLLPILFLGVSVTNVIAWLIVFALPLRKEGQNVGMKLFGCRVVSSDGAALSWSSIVKRELTAGVLNEVGIGLLGYLGVFIGTGERTMYDRLSRTEVVKTSARIEFINRFRSHIAEQDAHEKVRQASLH